MTAPSAIPCLTLPTHFPNVITRPKGITRHAKISNALVKPLGFSKGCAAFALKNPPPLVPRSLMASWDATGPWAIVCTPLVSVCTIE